MSGIGPEEFLNVYNLVISTESARILVKELNNKKGWELLSIWAPTIAAFLSAVTAGISTYIAWQTNKNSLKIQKASLNISKNSTKISHDSFIANIHKLYFDLDSKQNNPPDINDIRIMCNYLEFVCNLYNQNILKNKDLYFLSTLFEDKSLIKYAELQFKENPKSYCEFFKYIKNNI